MNDRQAEPPRNFWEFLDATVDRLPGWPDERQWVTMWIFGMAFFMLRMAVINGDLWTVELFKILLQAIIISAIIGSIVAFHFSANKSGQELDAKRADNTGKMADAIAAVATGSPAPPAVEPDIVLQPGETAQAAEDDGEAK